MKCLMREALQEVLIDEPDYEWLMIDAIAFEFFFMRVSFLDSLSLSYSSLIFSTSRLHGLRIRLSSYVLNYC